MEIRYVILISMVGAIGFLERASLICLNSALQAVIVSCIIALGELKRE